MIAIAAVLIHVAVPKVDRALTGLRVRSTFGTATFAFVLDGNPRGPRDSDERKFLW
jgi:hypothetical protein